MPDKRRQGQAEQLTYFSLCSTEQECGQIHCCSRICSGQSIQKPQRATKIGKHTVSNSIKSTYSHSISPGFHKCSDLLREQRVGGSKACQPALARWPNDRGVLDTMLLFLEISRCRD